MHTTHERNLFLTEHNTLFKKSTFCPKIPLTYHFWCLLGIRVSLCSILLKKSKIQKKKILDKNQTFETVCRMLCNTSSGECGTTPSAQSKTSFLLISLWTHTHNIWSLHSFETCLPKNLFCKRPHIIATHTCSWGHIWRSFVT